MPELPVLQLITTAALTVVGIVVSAAALIVAYRNNFGWKPIIIITGWNVEIPGAEQSGNFELTFEFWNRQKYPVVIREMSLVVEGMEISWADREKWDVIGDTMRQRRWHTMHQRRSDETVAPTTYKTVKIEFTASVSAQAWTKKRGRRYYVLTVRYFDPTHRRGEFEVRWRARSPFFS